MQFFRKRARTQSKRLLVIGLDCASPELVFDQFAADLPNITRLRQSGTWGTLESSIPCITVPAWSSMLTGRDPGELGFYGFRNRTDYRYGKMGVVNSASVKYKRVWDYLSDAGKSCFVANVPQTYPPKAVNGKLISGFLTPGTDSAFTYPAIYRQDVLKTAPNYAFDVKDFRTDDKAGLSQRLFDLAEVQHTVLKAALQSQAWDFFMHVNIGVDRVHHGFWRFHDSQHREYTADSPFKSVIRDYYKMVDTHIGELLALAGDDVQVLVVSDHGVKRMDGGICINEWLWRNGWLTFKTPPPEGRLSRFDDLEVDWTRTKAWGAGGYYARVFLNVEGREPNGVIPAADYESVRDELAQALAAIQVPDEPSFASTTYKPEAIYRQVNNIAPDLIVYFGDLHWRSVGSLGHGKHYTFENDTGQDDANHAQHGMFILNTSGESGGGEVNHTYQLMDIAPTILTHMGVDLPTDMDGNIIR